MNTVSDTRWPAFNGLRVLPWCVPCISVIRVASQLLPSYRHVHRTAQFKGGVTLAMKLRVAITPDRNLSPRKSLVMPYQQKKCWFTSGMTWCYSRLVLSVQYEIGHIAVQWDIPASVHVFCKLCIFQDARYVNICGIRICCVHLLNHLSELM